MSNAVIGALRVNMSISSAEFASGVAQVQNSLTGLRGSVDSVAARVSRFGNVLTAVAGAMAIGSIANMADQYSDLNARVGIATGSMDQSTATMQKLASIASMTYSSISTVTEGFIQNNQVLSDMGKSTDEVMSYTEALANSLIVSGAKGEKAASVQKALSDAMVLGSLRGDQLNTVLKDGDAVAAALAQELGTTITGLRALGSEGKITGDVIANTIIKNQEKWAEQAASMPGTFGDAATAMSNMAVAVAGRFDQITGAGEKFTGGVKAMADSVANFAMSNSFETVLNGIGSAIEYVAVAVAGLATTQLVGLVTSASRAVMAVSLMEVQFIAGAAAARGMTVATYALNTALKLVGGPIGIFVTAATVLGYVLYKNKQETAELNAEVEKLPGRIKDADAAYTEFSKNRTRENAEAAKARLTEELAAREAALALKQAELDKLETIANNQLKPVLGGAYKDSPELVAARDSVRTLGFEAANTRFKIDELNTSLNAPKDAAIIEATNAQKKIADQINAQTEAARVKLATDQELAAIARQYGQDSLQYATAEADAKRDAAVAAAEKLATEHQGVSIIRDAADGAIQQANATYDAEVAAWRFNDAMAATKNQIQGIVGLLSAIGGGMIDRAAKFAGLKALEAGKTAAEAQKIIQYAKEDNALAAKRIELEQKHGKLVGGVYASTLEMNARLGRQTDEKLEAAMEKATKAERAAKKASKGGGGSSKKKGGSSEAERERKREEQSVEALNKRLEELRKTMGMTAEAERVWKAQRDAGVLGNAEGMKSIAQIVNETASLEKMREEIEKSQNAIEKMGDQLASVFASIVTGSESGKTAIANLLKQMASTVASNAFKTFFNSIIGAGGGGGWLGTMAKWAFGDVGANANGTSGWGGGLTWVGERGPELVNLNRGAQVFDNRKSMAIANGATAGGKSTILVELSPDLLGRVLQEANQNSIQIAKASAESVTKSLPGQIRKYSSDPRKS